MVSLKHSGTVPLPNRVLPGREIRNKPALLTYTFSHGKKAKLEGEISRKSKPAIS